MRNKSAQNYNIFFKIEKYKIEKTQKSFFCNVKMAKRRI